MMAPITVRTATGNDISISNAARQLVSQRRSVLNNILTRHDAGESVKAIAAAEDVSFGYVYGLLREHRPQRQRKPRTRTSQKRKLILGLVASGIAAPRVAFLASCTPAYVYALIKQENHA